MKIRKQNLKPIIQYSFLIKINKINTKVIHSNIILAWKNKLITWKLAKNIYLIYYFIPKDLGLMIKSAH